MSKGVAIVALTSSLTRLHLLKCLILNSCSAFVVVLLTQA